uniref:Myb/SANT-like domain-containing protein n=1 Tax=Chenopodium quinoa TaxID=63459 RepID=A0A803MVA9_CHEQI
MQNNPRFFPWFEDFIGAIDGTHIRASVPIEMQGRFRGRKGGTTQNMLGAVDFDMKFTYVVVGWEVSAHYSKVLQDALKRRFKVPKGKYYLADAGYGDRKGFIPPYRRIRYTSKKEKKVNFRWSKDMSKELLDFLAEEVKKGNRPNNTFRTSSIVAAAKIISEKFQTNCTSEHVENHMNTVRNAWVAISTEYPKYEKFLNRKIDMYEELAIVVGKDLARGNTFADIDVDASMESGQPSMTIDSVPSKAESGTSSGSRPHRKRSRIDEGSEMEHISAQLQEVVSDFKKFTNNQLDVEKLYDEIIKMEDIEEGVRVAAFDHLFALAIFKVITLVAICCLVLVHSALPFVSCFLLLFCYNCYAAALLMPGVYVAASGC